MRSAVLQFLVAGALVVAWTWILGRPLLTALLRRPRRDSIGHFRYQQAVLGRSVGADVGRGPGWLVIGPIVDWWRQPVERRRLQVMMGFALATFASVLLAIALRGPFIRLFLLMTIGFTAYLLLAASVGARELRAREAERAEASVREASAALARRSQDLAVGTGELLTGTGVAGALFDDGFFEPIPELDPRTASGRRAVDRANRTTDDDADNERPAAAETSIFAQSDRATEPTGAAGSPGGEAVPATEVDPGFTAPAPERARPVRRPRARPIYIESDLEDDPARAVND